ncbi:MAG: mechanosensitive ion channel family protein [Chloroflexi bacterium]|nr:MAG: mechanosensitive ion channel family protein [Chloroflexota bacterium]
MLTWLWQQRAGHVAMIVYGLLILAASLLVARVMRGLARRQFRRTRVDLQVSVLATRLITVAVILIGIIFAFTVWFGNPALVFGGFGVFALAFGLAFQDILKNFIAGIFLLLERPFRIGDEITADNRTGVVENVEMRTTTLRTEDGEEVLIPNSLVYTSTIVNRTRFPARQFTVSTRVPDATALDGLADRVRDQVRALHEVLSDPPPVTALVPAPDGSVALEVRYWLEYREHDPLTVRSAVSQRVHEAIQSGTAGGPVKR